MTDQSLPLTGPELVAALAADGCSIRAIARQTGMSRKKITLMLRSRPERSQQRARQRQEAMKLRRQGWSIQRIARHLAIGPKKVSELLNNAPASRHIPADVHDKLALGQQVWHLHCEGLSLTKIARQLHVSRDRVTSIVRALQASEATGQNYSIKLEGRVLCPDCGLAITEYPCRKCQSEQAPPAPATVEEEEDLRLRLATDEQRRRYRAMRRARRKSLANGEAGRSLYEPPVGRCLNLSPTALGLEEVEIPSEQLIVHQGARGT